MKKIFILSLVFMFNLLFFQFCSRNTHAQKEEHIDFKSISIINKSGKDFMGMGKLKKVIKLEITDNSIIGEIDKIYVDNKNGDFYVLDRFIGKKVFRFNKEGKFLNYYGVIGQGPGEYTDIMSFTLDSNEHVNILTPNKLIKFEKNGQLLSEKKIKFSSFDITSLSDKIYIFVLSYKSTPKIMPKKSILILDNNFNEVDGLFPFDIRLEKYRFLCLRNLSVNKDRLFFIDNYNLGLKIYDTVKDKTYILEIPNENENLDDIWRKTNFVEEDMTEIKNKLHRFNSVITLNDILFLSEYCKEKKIFNYWLLNLKNKKAIIYNYSWEEFAAGKLFFLSLYCSYDKGFIGVFADDATFKTFKNTYGKDYPFLKDIEYSMEDNPVLFFYEYDDKIWE